MFARVDFAFYHFINRHKKERVWRLESNSMRGTLTVLAVIKSEYG